MKDNIGSVDRTVRLAVGVLLGVIGVAVFASVLDLGPVAGGLALVVGAILVGTGLINTCPLYGVVGVDTSGSR